jgi:flagellar protein FliO/FliZ
MAALDIAQYLISFGLVIGLLLAALWGLKKVQMQGGLRKRSNSQRLQILESVSLGARQKILLIRCDEQDLMVGVTPGEIRPLHVLPSAAESTAEWLRRRQS